MPAVHGRPRFGDYPNLYSDWANLGLFSIYFVLGILLARWPPLEPALRSARGLLLALLVASTVAASLVGEPVLRSAIGAVVGWSVVAWSIASAHLVRWPAPLRDPELQRSSLAIYVLHHTPLLVAAYALTRSDLPVLAQALSISLGSIGATAALLALAWRWALTRRLFGLRRTGLTTAET